MGYYPEPKTDLDVMWVIDDTYIQEVVWSNWAGSKEPQVKGK